MTGFPPLVIPDPTLSLYIECVRGPIFSCNGQYLAGIERTAGERNFVHIRKIGDGNFVERFLYPIQQEIICIAFSPRDPQIIAMAIENNVFFCTIRDESGLECFETISHEYHIASFGFFPDGTSILI